MTIYATRPKNPTNDDNMVKYSEDFPADYTTVVDGEGSISFPDIPLGATVIKVWVEIKPLKDSGDWTWNANSRILTITDPSSIYAGQLISLIYKILQKK